MKLVPCEKQNIKLRTKIENKLHLVHLLMNSYHRIMISPLKTSLFNHIISKEIS